MMCQICKNEGVLNSVNGNEFYYCRTCKVEIPLEEKPQDDPGHNNYDDWTYWDSMDTMNTDYDIQTHFFNWDAWSQNIKRFQG